MEMESLENVGKIRGCQPILTKNNTISNEYIGRQ